MERLVPIIKAWQSPGTEPGKARLITIPFSHYNEKARWALDWSPLEYTEDGHPPGFHAIFTREFSRDHSTTTPLLVLPSGEVLQDSTAILEYLYHKYPKEMGWLYPPEVKAQVQAFVKEVSGAFGADVRRWAYAHLINLKQEGLELFRSNTSKVEALLITIVVPKVIQALTKAFNLTDPQVISDTEAVCIETFDKVSAMLADGRKYLFNTDRPTAADITFAALAEIIVFPPQLAHVMVGFDPDKLPHAMQATRERFLSTPAGRFVLRLYSEDRFPPGYPSTFYVEVKSKKRDRVPPTAIVAGLSILGLGLAFALGRRRLFSRL